MSGGAMDPHEIARLQFVALANEDVDLARRIVAPDHVNHMAVDEPPACGIPGPPGFLATSAWLRGAFSDAAWEPHECVAEGDVVTLRVTFRGRHTAPFVLFPAGGSPAILPASGRAFAVPQIHVFRLRGGQAVAHRAVRDDLGMMTQLGLMPPRPAVVGRMVLDGVLRRRARIIQETIERTARAARRAT